LLAQRKAELEREQEVGRDEELEAMMEDIGTKPGPSVPVKAKLKEEGAEKLGTGVCIPSTLRHKAHN
jgi:IK cytokine